MHPLRRPRPGKIAFVLAQSACLFVLLLIGIGSARADLKVCNNSFEDISFSTTFRYTGPVTNPAPIALGTQCRSDERWTAGGWWTIPRCKCRVVYFGSLHGQVFHWTAFGSSGGQWGSDSLAEIWRVPKIAHNQCNTVIESYCKINGDDACMSRGHWLYNSRFDDGSLIVNPGNKFGTDEKCSEENNDGDPSACLGFDLSNCH